MAAVVTNTKRTGQGACGLPGTLRVGGVETNGILDQCEGGLVRPPASTAGPAAANYV